MKKVIINLLKIALSGAISLVIISGFCLVFNYTGCHITNNDGSTDYKWEPNQFFSTMKEGFAWFQFDKNGFNNENDTSFDVQPVDILLMGSSHMEAVQIKPNENTAAQLNKLLPNYRTYNIGVSGHNIYTCVQNMESASKQYNPKKYVVLETSDIKLNINSMNKVVNNKFPKIPSYDSGLVYNVQKTVPAAKSLYKSITDWMNASQLQKNQESTLPTSDFCESFEYENALDHFLHKASKSVSDDCQLIIFYQPTTEIDENGKYIINNTDGVDLFREVCEKYDIIFVDETNRFKELYDTKHILAHGFSNSAIGAGHLNRYGHQVVADSLADAITEKERENHDAK